MSIQRSPGGAEVRGRLGKPRSAWVWRLFQLITLVAMGWAGWRLLGHLPYRIDIDVYRMGGRAWLNGDPLYADGAIFHTRAGLDLPFTYPPLAAVMFAPFAWLSLEAAGVGITLTTLVLLIVATVIVLTRLDVWPDSAATTEPAWLRRCWLAAAMVAPAVILVEPIRSNFEFGQINVVLMTLVIADCVPRRTPWPRGMLLGIAIALKLTPAVFVLYFLLRRDGRALITTTVTAVLATLAGFALAWRDSWEYWTGTVSNTDRIGSATLNTNQNIAGALARLGLGESERFGLWVLASFAVLALTVWAVLRVLRDSDPDGDAPVLALMCVAMFGLVVSPVSWSHHWVWALPAVLVAAVVAVRRHAPALAVLAALGLTLLVWTPIRLLPENEEMTAALWRQLLGGSYVWWALAFIVVIGALGSDSDRLRTADPDRVSAVN